MRDTGHLVTIPQREVLSPSLPPEKAWSRCAELREGRYERLWGRRPFPPFLAKLFHASESSLEVEVSCLKILRGHLVLQFHPHIVQKGHRLLFASLQAEVWSLLGAPSDVVSLFVKTVGPCAVVYSASGPPLTAAALQVRCLTGSGWHLESAQETCPGVVGREQAPGNLRSVPGSAPVPCSLGELWALPPLRPCAQKQS